MTRHTPLPHIHGQTQPTPGAPPPCAAPTTRRLWGQQVLALAMASSGLHAQTPTDTAASASADTTAEAPSPAERAERAFWDLLAEGGCVVLMRHTQTEPGAGDPPEFDLRRCDTQRNLSDVGRAQARDWGARFVQAHVKLADVRSSAWCRCQDTARLAFGRVRVWSPLNSFFEDPERAQVQTVDAIRLIQAHRSARNLVLVTHQVNISALTHAVPAMGDMLLVRPLPTTPPVGTPYPVLARLTAPDPR